MVSVFVDALCCVVLLETFVYIYTMFEGIPETEEVVIVFCDLPPRVCLDGGRDELPRRGIQLLFSVIFLLRLQILDKYVMLLSGSLDK